MWGEIEPQIKTRPSLCRKQNVDEAKQPEDVTTDSLEGHLPLLVHPQQSHTHVLDESQNEAPCVMDMVEAVARSGSPVKSQQIGEPELSLAERRQELLLQYRGKPLVFLERYHACLKPHDLSAFAHVASDPRAQHYSKVIQRRAAACTNRTRVRNQRYAALRALQKEGTYFSEEQMRIREPLLYEQYIGQYLTDEEIFERSQEAMKANSAEGPECGTAGLASLLLNTYQEQLIQTRLQEQQENEEGAQEEEEESDDDPEPQQQQDEKPTAEEKALLREEFVTAMHQRFLDGKDKDFDYSEVDENPDYDNLDIISRDAEEKYFDEEDGDDDDDDEKEEVDDKEEHMSE